jgi:hypothetical protein
MATRGELWLARTDDEAPRGAGVAVDQPWTAVHGSTVGHLHTPKGYMILAIGTGLCGLGGVAGCGSPEPPGTERPRRRFAGVDRRRRCGASEMTGKGREGRVGDGELTRWLGTSGGAV